MRAVAKASTFPAIGQRPVRVRSPPFTFTFTPRPTLCPVLHSRSSIVVPAISFDAAPTEVLLGGGALIVATTGYLVWETIKAMGQGEAPPVASTEKVAEAVLPRENAVVVFGGSGRTGRMIVKELLAGGRTVIAAVRNRQRALEAFQSFGVTEGRQDSSGGNGILFIEDGVDVTDSSTLTQQLFAGATQVVLALGAVYGRKSDGSMGYIDDMSPERVDAGGVANVATAAKGFLQVRSSGSTAMKTVTDLGQWQRLDDVIMGGNSSSLLERKQDNTGAVWRGELVVEGGGFCGARSEVMSLDLGAYDGVALRVKGGGRRLKLNIKTDTFIEPEDTYQATFETAQGDAWTNVFLPWHEFVAVKRARTVPNGPPLDPSKIRQFGLVYSRFAFNGYPNESYTPGPFTIEFEGGIQAYVQPRPQLVLISSAGVERNARIGNDEDARKAEIPIIQLNPGGILNHKYAGETAVRTSGLLYTVIRPTGINDDESARKGEGPALLEMHQGDAISGKLSRKDVAFVVANALSLPSSCGKTVEIRRSEAADAVDKSSTPRRMLTQFLMAVPDRRRTHVGLEPFPAVVPPPPPPSEKRVSEILDDPRVKEAVAQNKGRRVRSEEGDEAVSPSATTDFSKERPENVVEAREWIRRWRANSLEKQLAVETNGAVRNSSSKN